MEPVPVDRHDRPVGSGTGRVPVTNIRPAGHAGQLPVTLLSERSHRFYKCGLKYLITCKIFDDMDLEFMNSDKVRFEQLKKYTDNLKRNSYAGLVLY